MTPERWQNVREVLAKALELKDDERVEFLDRACSSDHSLRAEVERLLSSSNEVQSTFLRSSALHFGIAPGTKLGDYEVLKLLGSGGMGEVYRARDTRLRRDVAIKVIPSALLNDPERLRRFEQEARAAASLNHPNILAVFQMGTYQGVPYLVSELLDGSTLRDELLCGIIPSRKSIDYSVQTARGLAAAHDRGIIHRDLKPENLFLTKDGRVKILDFGLAKLTQPRSLEEGTVTKGTEPGVVMGTVGYMSPEQVSAKQTDHRTDIFSFGAILYEMVTGKRAFQKPTAAETMSAILSEEPLAISQVTLSVSPALQKIVQRCLEKNPAQRFQSASDLAFALESLSDSGSSSATVSYNEPGRQRWIFLALAAVIVVLAALGFFVSRSRSTIIPPADWVQITDFADSVTAPAFSPDGRMLTFLRGDDSFVTAGQVYVMLLPRSAPVRLTNDDKPKMSPVFGPDGATIAYTVPWDTWTVPVLGGSPQFWLPNASGVTWLNQDNLMFSQITTGNHMELVSSDLSRAHVRLIYSPDVTGMVHRSYLSPDQKWVIAVEMGGNFWDRCRLVPFDGSSAGNLIGPADGICINAAWSPDGKWMYLNTNSGNAFHIWRQQFPGGKIEQLTSGPTEEEGLAMAPDGKSFITSVGIRRTGVWLHDSRGDRVLTSEATAALADPRSGSPFSPDGRKLYYLVRRTPGREVNPEMAIGELWQMDLQSGATQTAMPGFSIADFSFSPDGRQIAFSALGDVTGVGNDRKFNLWVAPADHSAPARLLQTSANRSHFASGFIYYVKRTPDGGYVHRVRPDGTDDQQIWDGKVVSMTTSPDGRYLAVAEPAREDGEWRLEIVDWAQKRVQPICNDVLAYWSEDGRSLIFFTGIGKLRRNTSTYLVAIPPGKDLPDFPPDGFSEFSQITKLKNARMIPEHLIALGRIPDTYAYVKASVQRNLYSIPLR